MEQADGVEIELRYDYREPVELMDLAISFRSFAENYVLNAVNSGVDADDDIRLHVIDISSGSIVTRLRSISRQPRIVGEAENHQEAAVSFTKRIGLIWDWLAGKIEWPENEVPATNTEIKNSANSLAVVAKDNKANLSLNLSLFGKVEQTIVYNSTEARAVQDGARRELERRPLPEVLYHHRQLLTLFQARNDKRGKAGDFGIISKFSTKAVKLLYASDDIKPAILASTHPFDSTFIVDVEVMIANDQIKAYKIFCIHEVI